MNVLVTVASRHGATDEIGSRIAQRLVEHGHRAVLMRPEDVAELAPYDAVVLGSAVYMGKWIPAAAAFASRHALALADRPVWLFSSGPLGDPPLPAGEPSEVTAVARRVRAREHRTFAGELQEGVLGIGERLIVKMVKAPFGDFRDWSAIDAWTDTIADALAARPLLV